MLRLSRRHLKSCPHRSLTCRRCKCPVWVFGTKNGRRIRKSLNTVNWEKGEQILLELDYEPRELMTVADACGRFMADCGARGLGPAQTAKYKLLTKELEEALGKSDITAVTLDELRKLREGWDLAPISAAKKLERLRTFLRICMDSGWIQNNPARLLKAPKVKPAPTLPFSSEEWEKITWALELYPDRPKGRRAQVKAFVLLLRYSGLRIGDAVSLETKRIQDGKLLLYTAKAGTPVWLPLPEEVLSSLQHVSLCDRFFWSGNGLLKSAVADWQRSLSKLFKLAGIKGHALMFRDTLAVDLLSRGVSLENVAALLGNTVRVCEKHYSPWVRARQDALELEIKKIWK